MGTLDDANSNEAVVGDKKKLTSSDFFKFRTLECQRLVDFHEFRGKSELYFLEQMNCVELFKYCNVLRDLGVAGESS